MRPVTRYLSESDFIGALRSGNREAFELLVEKYQEQVFRTAKGFVHSSDDAEDIAQEVFIEVYRSAEKFRGDSELSTWIYRITVNKSINFINSSTRRKFISFFELGKSFENKNVESDFIAPEEYSADNEINRSEYARAIKKAIDNLPNKQKTAFILSRYNDLSYKEISLVIKTSVASVESLLFRAKKNLQKRLFKFYEKNML